MNLNFRRKDTLTNLDREKQANLERKYFKEVGVIPGILKYRMKEVYKGLLIGLIGYILASNISFINGKLIWTPSIKTNINLEVKK